MPGAQSAYELTRYDTTLDQTLNSDAQRVNNFNVIDRVSTLGDGSFNDVYDAGFVPPLTGSTLGDRVWLDYNNNGVQDAGEEV